MQAAALAAGLEAGAGDLQRRRCAGCAGLPLRLAHPAQHAFVPHTQSLAAHVHAFDATVLVAVPSWHPRYPPAHHRALEALATFSLSGLGV